MVHKAKERQGITSAQMISKVLVLMLVVILILLAWFFIHWLGKPGNFSIKKIELVSQLENQEVKELNKMATGVLNGGFFSLNIEDFTRSLLLKLPWVKSISVKKIWPDKLLINIVEHKPIVRWLSVEENITDVVLDNVQLLSQEGLIISPALTAQQKIKFNRMVLLTGTKNSTQTVLSLCLQINESFKQLGLGIKQCGMNARRTWKVVLILNKGQEITIKLGKKNMIQKLKRFIHIFSGQLKHYLVDINSVDLRYVNGFSVNWKIRSALSGQELMLEREVKQSEQQLIKETGI